MASNFRIDVHQNGDSLHLKLLGNFDGSSACELLNVLQKHSNGFQRVFIHTDSLNNIHPFGLGTFQSKFNILNREKNHLLFTGENANWIAPENGMCL